MADESWGMERQNEDGNDRKEGGLFVSGGARQRKGDCILFIKSDDF